MENEIPKTTRTYAPMILGGITILLSVFSYFAGPIFTNWELALTVTLVLRLFFIIYGISICKTYEMKALKWSILIFIFGGWALIALNIALLMKLTNPQKPETIIVNPTAGFSLIPGQPQVISEYSGENEPVQPTIYTHCPACGNGLDAKKYCDDCDLAFD